LKYFLTYECKPGARSSAVTKFHTKFVHTFMIYLHTEFHMPSSNVSLVVTTKHEAICTLHKATILFYILQKHNLNGSYIFFWRTSTML